MDADKSKARQESETLSGELSLTAMPKQEIGSMLVPEVGRFDSASPALTEADSEEHRARKWLRGRMERLTSNTRYTNASNALVASKSTSFDCDDFSRMLTLFACMAVTPKGSSRKTFEKAWTLETGKTWKALKEFPDRLRKMADEVERVNSSPFFSPSQYVNAATRSAELVRTRFKIIPGTLRVFAEGLRQHIARVPVLTDQYYPRTKILPMHFVVSVSFCVKACTGKYRDAQVSELLEAAALALGERKSFDALTIAQTRLRFKRWKKT